MEANQNELKKYALGDVKEEIKSTRRVLESVPEESFDWKPHDKSWSLGELAAHIANLPMWQTTILSEDEFDIASVPPPIGAPSSKKELLKTFDRNSESMLQALDQSGDDALADEWTLRRGDKTMLARPRALAFRSMGITT